MRTRALIGLLLLTAHPAAADEPQAPSLTLVQPSPRPPVVKSGPVRGQAAEGLRTAASPSGEMSDLRAVSLREGSGVISLAGATRPVRPGDRIGTATVKAVGSDRIILETQGTLVSSAPPGASAAATIVVTFGHDGRARVRSYAAMTSQASPQESR